MEMNYLNWEESLNVLKDGISTKYLDKGFLMDGANLDESAYDWFWDGFKYVEDTNPASENTPIYDKEFLIANKYYDPVNHTINWSRFSINVLGSAENYGYIVLHGEWKTSDINLSFINTWFSLVGFHTETLDVNNGLIRTVTGDPNQQTKYLYSQKYILVDPMPDWKISSNQAGWYGSYNLTSDGILSGRSFGSESDSPEYIEQIQFSVVTKANPTGKDFQEYPVDNLMTINPISNSITLNEFVKETLNIKTESYNKYSDELFRRLLNKAVLSDTLFSLDDEKSVKHKWMQILNTIRTTQDEYSKLIELQESNIDKINDAIKTSSNNVIKYKDTPQVGAAYGGDGYNTTVTVTENESTVAMSLADKLDIAYKFLNDIYDKWLAKFNTYFMY